MRTTEDLREELWAQAREAEGWALPPVATPRRRPGRRLRNAGVVLAAAAAVAAVVVVPRVLPGTAGTGTPATRPSPGASAGPAPLGSLGFAVLPRDAWAPAGIATQHVPDCRGPARDCTLPDRLRVDGRVVAQAQVYATYPRGRAPQGPRSVQESRGGPEQVVWVRVSLIGQRAGSRVVLTVRGHGRRVLTDRVTLVRVPVLPRCARCGADYRAGYRVAVEETGASTARERIVLTTYIAGPGPMTPTS